MGKKAVRNPAATKRWRCSCRTCNCSHFMSVSRMSCCCVALRVPCLQTHGGAPSVTSKSNQAPVSSLILSTTYQQVALLKRRQYLDIQLANSVTEHNSLRQPRVPEQHSPELYLMLQHLEAKELHMVVAGKETCQQDRLNPAERDKEPVFGHGFQNTTLQNRRMNKTCFRDTIFTEPETLLRYGPQPYVC